MYARGFSAFLTSYGNGIISFPTNFANLWHSRWMGSVENAVYVNAINLYFPQDFLLLTVFHGYKITPIFPIYGAFCRKGDFNEKKYSVLLLAEFKIANINKHQNFGLSSSKGFVAASVL